MFAQTQKASETNTHTGCVRCKQRVNIGRHSGNNAKHMGGSLRCRDLRRGSNYPCCARSWFLISLCWRRCLGRHTLELSTQAVRHIKTISISTHYNVVTNQSHSWTVTIHSFQKNNQTLNGLRQANLVLIAYASSEGSGEPAHPRSLARTSTARSYKQ